METVYSLRQKGYKVRVSHFRYTEYEDFRETKLILKLRSEFNKQKNGNSKILEKGGKTVVDISMGGLHLNGEAYCSLEDNFDRKKGLQIALARALNSEKISMHLTFEEIKEIRTMLEHSKNHNVPSKQLFLDRTQAIQTLVPYHNKFYTSNYDKIKHNDENMPF